MKLSIKHAGLSHRGLVREENEDNWAADAEQGLYIVSDGLGGAPAGALASKIVVESLPKLTRKRMRGIRDLAVPRAARQLATALADLSTEVSDQTHGEPGLEGMGATVVLAKILKCQALIAHMGDSRAYLFRRDRLEQLTKDHSVVQLLIDAGEISPSEAASHPARGQVTRSVGMEGEPLPETRLLTLEPGDRLMLCTDGLTGMLDDDAISSILKLEANTKGACQRLIQAALDAGGKDNVTAVVLDVSAA